MKMSLRKNEQGFTLLEVMLVVIIIGIIAVIALPKLLVTKGEAENASCNSNLQALRTANEQCKWSTGSYGEGADVPALIASLTTGGYLPADSSVSGDCPGTGDYTYDEDTGSILCSAHPLTEEE